MASSEEDTLPPDAWLQSLDATYALFEVEKNRQQYPHLSGQVRHAVQLCEEVLQEYGIQQCALSFNGGKDCTVLVHILSAVYRRLSRSSQSSSSACKLEDLLPPIPSLYITCSSPFAEVEDFVRASNRRYNLQTVRMGGDMKEGLRDYLAGKGDAHQNGTGVKVEELHKTRHVKAIFIGTRRTDPHGANLRARNHTDDGWPPVERIQPILDWSYKDVWDFLRCPLFAVAADDIKLSKEGTQWGDASGIPYCKLYDEGYTSLGSTYNTHPNPTLDTRKGKPVGKDDTHTGRWQPAYMLQDGSLERAGRN